jgi:hypothetical protein
MISEEVDPQSERKDASLVFSYPWVTLVIPSILLMPLIPYFLSSAVLFTHNPVDEAIVDILGSAYIKPVLLVLLLLGSLIGLGTIPFSKKLFTMVKNDGQVPMIGKRRWLRLFLPWFGMLSYPIHEVVTYVSPGPPWDWGALSTFFFTFPGFGFAMSASIVILVVYRGTKSEAKEKGLTLKMTYHPRMRNSYLIELVPILSSPET